jgi:hypothetical protein
MEEKYWIVEKFDGAIMGMVRGEQKQETVSGPHQSYEEAMKIKNREYQRFGCYYYTIVESDTKPERKNKNYEFVDAHHEFDDC